MKIDLSQIRIEFPEKPFIGRNFRKDYKVFGFLGDDMVGHITVSILDNLVEEKDDFWFQKNGPGVWASRPVAFFQDTLEEFRGYGVSGRLLVLTNDETKKRYNMSLASSFSFRSNPFNEWREKGFAERPAKRVWEKLELEGLAYRRDCYGLPRWVMR